MTSGAQAARLTHKIRGSRAQQLAWESRREAVMYKVLKCKFSVPEYKKNLQLTGDVHLCEASPVDRYWGCGLTVLEARQRSPDQYPGRNTLGLLLMRIRGEL